MKKIAELPKGDFNKKNFYHQMLIIALPVMIQNFISSFLNMIDTVMVGRLGETEIAAVGIANQYFFFFNMFLIGLCAGCSIFISQFWGKKDIVNIKRIVGIGLLSVTIVSFVFMVLGVLNPNKVMALFNNDPIVIDLGSKYLKISLISYFFTGITFVYSFSLRSIGNAVQPMLISVVALVSNAFLNYIFIFGNFGAPALGVEGAAVATLIARVMEAVILVVSVYIRKGVLAASLRELLDFTFGFIKKSYRTIFPVILNDMCWGLASLVYVAVYGRMGTQEVAAIQICNTINNLFMVVIFGLSSAAAVMIGNSIGAEEEWLTRKYARTFSILSIQVGFVLGVIVAVTSPAILNFFNVSDIVRDSSQIILLIISVIFFIRVLGIMIIVGILRGGGDATHAFIIEGITMWFIGVPITIVGAFVFQFPVYIVYGLAVIEEIAKCILGLLRLKSERWIKNVTHNMNN
ncbi:MAG: MATE family efflux transporter [Bacillota bacterium]